MARAFLKGWFARVSRTRAEREFDGLIESSISLLRIENYPEARKQLLRAVAHDLASERPEVLAWILDRLWATWEQTENYQEATTFFSSFLSDRSQSALAYHLRACAEWYSGMLGQALADYSRARELDPNDISALSSRGQVLIELGDFEGARRDLELALASELPTQNADPIWKRQWEGYARNGLGAALAGLGDFDGAMKEFDKSVALCP